MNKKIFFTIATLSSGGAERVISILSNHMINNGYDVTVLMWLDGSVFYEFDKRVRIISIEQQCDSKNVLRKMIWLRKFVKKEQPSLLFSFLAIFSILTLISLIGLPTKVIACERNDPRYTPFRQSLRTIRNMLYHFADGILTQTDNNKKYFSSKLQQKTQVIYNPVFIDSQIVGTAPMSVKENVILSIARLQPQKNQKMIIRSFSLFLEMHPDYELVILGKGKCKEELVRYADSLGIADKVKFPGVVSNVYDYLKSAKVFVLSSLFEGMPNTLIEAMCIGVPCISTKVSGAVDLIQDAENGYLVEINDSETMAQRMCAIVEDKSLARKIGINATKIFARLNENAICSEWEDYIENALA